MSEKFVADGHTIIALQGIRFVERADNTWGGNTSWRLRVTYKGDKLDFEYPDAESRDAQYEALRAAVTKARANGAAWQTARVPDAP